MRFVIATLPDVKFNLGRDLGLVKACALYGEDSVLFSPTYEGTEPFIDFGSRPLLHQLIYSALFYRDPGFVFGEKLSEQERSARIKAAEEKSDGIRAKAEQVADIIRNARSEAEAELELAAIAAEVEPLVGNMGRVFSNKLDLVRRSKELLRAQELGLIKIASIYPTPRLSFSPEKLRDDVGAELSRGDSYGALDERFLGEFTKLSKGRVHKVSAALIAADMLGRLPGFSSATIDEICDLRRELATCVHGFRKAVVELSGKVKSAPWDDDFPHDVERELQLRLYSAICEIEDQVRSNSYIAEILRRAVKNPLLIPSTSAFGLLLSSATHASSLVGQIASGVAGASLLAFEAREVWKASRSKVEGNELFFYYRASKLLSKKAKRVQSNDA